MHNLVLKDLEAAKWLLLLVMPIGLLQIAVFASYGPAFPIAALVFAGLLAFGSIAIEEVQRTEILWSSLPLTRGQIVAGRYLTVLIGILAGLGTSWAVARIVLVSGAAEAEVAPFVGLKVHTLLFVVLILAAAVYLPLYFRFGAGRGLTIFSALAVAGLIALTLLVQLLLTLKGYPSPVVDPEAWKELGPEVQAKLEALIEPLAVLILGVLSGLSALALALSAYISRQLYESRDL